MAERRSLTTGEIAKYCGVNFRTVIRWIERGRLNAYKLPGRGDNRVLIPDFLTFLREHKMPIPEELQDNPRRVLIVDDDLAMAKTMRRTLNRNGFETLVASNGFQAGAWLGTFAPAIMTLDLKMPGLSGYEVLRLIRGMPETGSLKILVVSALSRDELDKALEAGADDVLAKPFRNEVLVDMVSRLAGVDTGGPVPVGRRTNE